MYQRLFSSRSFPGKPEKGDKADQAKAGKLEEVALSSNMIGLMYQGKCFSFLQFYSLPELSLNNSFKLSRKEIF